MGAPARAVRKGAGLRTSLNVGGGLLLLMGTTWFLQGINILPGSFMTGQIRWAAYGGMADLAGVALLVAANRRGRPSGMR